MSARRRRVGSESDQTPLIITTDRNQSLDQYDKHEGKLGNYKSADYKEEKSYPVAKKGIEPEITMTSRDRTKEFRSTVQKIRSGPFERPLRKSAHAASHAQFMEKAKSVGKNIAGTYEKLEKLTQLAKDRSLYNDNPGDIQELTSIIKGDINHLNQQIAALQEFSKNQRKTHLNGRQHVVSLSSNVVLALQSKLATMSSEFKQVLEVSTENLIHKKNRRSQFSQGAVSSSFPRSALSGTGQDSLLEQEVRVDIDAISDTQPLLAPQKQTLIYDQTEDYLQSRAETMQNIESTIVELGGIFQQLAHMVKEQEEMVDRIDSNVEATTLNVEAAHSEILKYFQSVMSNRWLMIKIFGVLIFFFMFFVIFMT